MQGGIGVLAAETKQAYCMFQQMDQARQSRKKEGIVENEVEEIVVEDLKEEIVFVTVERSATQSNDLDPNDCYLDARLA